MNKLIKKTVSVVAALAVTFSAAAIFEIPGRILVAAESTHSHKVCTGTSHDGCAHSEVEFEAFPDIENDGGMILRGKNYYLTKDIELGENSRIFVEKGTTNLCLNGHSIKKAGGEIIDINNIDGQQAELNICDCIGGGKVENTSENGDYSSIDVIDGTSFNLYGGEVSGGKNGVGIEISNDTEWTGSGGTVNIYGGTVRVQDEGGIWLRDSDTKLSIYGGELKSSNKCVIYAEGESSTVSVYGGTIDSAGPAISIDEKSALKISGGNINSRFSSVVTSSNDYIIRNYGTFSMTGGNINGKGSSTTYAIKNGKGADLNISGGTIETSQYALYSMTGSSASINGGKFLSEGYYCIWNNGTLDISSGSFDAANSPVINHGTLSISGGSFGLENTEGKKYVINNSILNLSGSPIFNNTSIWLQTDYNITISGALTNSEPYTVCVDSNLPRTFTSGWNDHMTDKNVSKYFKSPYEGSKIAYRDNEAAMFYYYKIAYDANGGNCSVQSAEADALDELTSLPADKITSLPVPTREGYIFDGWYTEKTGGEQVTADTVFIDDTTIYAHWACDHSWGDTYEKDKNQHWQVCTKCGAESEKSNHTWNDGEETTPPTETTEGVMTYKCTVCNAEKTEKIDKLPHTHTFSDDWTSDENGHWHAATCGHNVKSGEAEHNFGEPTVKPSTCTQHGSEEYVCQTCGYKKTVTLALAEHSFDGEWQKDENNHWKVCTICNAEKSEEAPHSWNGGEITKQPTENEAGVTLYTCTVCQATKTELIAPLGHTHNWNSDWSKDDTYHWHTCLNNCGEKKDEAVHTWNDGTVTIEPTEDTAGIMTYACTVCGAAKTETIAPLGHTHNWSGEWSKDDTYHWHTCLNNCGEKKDNGAHIWDGGTITKQPAADAEGERTFECTVCGKTKTETIPATDEPSEPDSGNILFDVQPGENAPETNLKTPFHELADAVLTPEEQGNIENGTDIKIILIVNDATESVPTDDKAKVETAIRGLSDYKLGQYLDITILKKIGDQTAEKITQTSKSIRVTFMIPSALCGKAEYSVVRVHGGETTVLKDLDSDPNTVTIETDKFSTYALVYKEKNTPSNPDGDNTSGENPGDSTNPPTTTAPTESDSSDYTTSDDVNPPRDDSSDTTPIESKPTDEGNSDTTSSDDDNTAPSDDGNTEPSESEASSSVSDHSPSESSPSEDNGNPSTGIAVSLIPLAAAAVLMVAVKHKKK